MLLGQPGVKADTWIVRFTDAALGRPVTSRQAELPCPPCAQTGMATIPKHTNWAPFSQLSGARRHKETALGPLPISQVPWHVRIVAGRGHEAATGTDKDGNAIGLISR